MTLGRCGDPPKDDSVVFIVVALILGIIAAIVVPLALAIGIAAL